jgi:hypothetical protein
LTFLVCSGKPSRADQDKHDIGPIDLLSNSNDEVLARGDLVDVAVDVLPAKSLCETIKQSSGVTDCIFAPVANEDRWDSHGYEISMQATGVSCLKKSLEVISVG